MEKEWSIADYDPAPIERFSSGVVVLDWIYGCSKINGQPVWGLPRGKITLMAGAMGTGKSRTCLFLAGDVLKQGLPVVYFQNELTLSTDKERREYASHWSFLNDRNLLKNLHVSDNRSLRFQLEFIMKHRPALVVVDSINELQEFKGGAGAQDIVNGYEADENHTEYCPGYRKVLASIGAHAIFLSHLNQQGGVKGNTELPHLVDIILFLTKSEIDGQFVMKTGKHRYGKTGVFSVWEHWSDMVAPISCPAIWDDKLFLDYHQSWYQRNKDKDPKRNIVEEHEATVKSKSIFEKTIEETTDEEAKILCQLAADHRLPQDGKVRGWFMRLGDRLTRMGE